MKIFRLLFFAFAFSPAALSEEQKDVLQNRKDLLAGQHWALCYSGFREGQHPDRGQGAANPSEDEILEDLKILHDQCGFKLIRLYDSRSNSETVLRLIREHDFDLTVLLGAWLSAEVNNPNCPWQTEPYPADQLAQNKVNNQQEIKRAINLAKRYSKQVIAVAVGNEALVDWNDHMVPVAQVIAYVKEVKAAIAQPVTVADNYEWWALHGQELAREVDFVSLHIYPVWEEKDIHQAMDYSIANIEKVRTALPESQLVITEAGWATIATEFGERASEKKQAIYYNNLENWAREKNITTFFFEAFDESWKGDPGSPWGAEKHWGIFSIDRTPKEVMKKHLKK